MGIEISEERDVSNLSTELQTRQAILERLIREMGEWKQKQSVDIPKSTPIDAPKSTLKPVVPSEPEQGSVAAVTDEMIEEALGFLDWMDNSKRTGWFAPIEELSFTVRAALISKFNANTFKSLRIGDYTYSRFGDQNQLIGKFSATKPEAKQ